MPTPTYVALATYTLTGNDSVVSFTSIPATYRDLVLVINPLANADNSMLVTINGSSSGFTSVRMLGYSGGAISTTSTTNELSGMQTNSSTVIFQFMDYAQTDKHKTILQRANFKGNDAAAYAHRWASTAAITSFSFNNPSFTFVAGATFSLYGIAG